MACSTAVRVISLKVTRSTRIPFSRFFSSSMARTCQLIASPSRSGSVARYSVLAPFSALAIAEI